MPDWARCKAPASGAATRQDFHLVRDLLAFGDLAHMIHQKRMAEQRTVENLDADALPQFGDGQRTAAGSRVVERERDVEGDADVRLQGKRGGHRPTQSDLLLGGRHREHLGRRLGLAQGAQHLQHDEHTHPVV